MNDERRASRGSSSLSHEHHRHQNFEYFVLLLAIHASLCYACYDARTTRGMNLIDAILHGKRKLTAAESSAALCLFTPFPCDFGDTT